MSVGQRIVDSEDDQGVKPLPRRPQHLILSQPPQSLFFFSSDGIPSPTPPNLRERNFDQATDTSKPSRTTPQVLDGQVQARVGWPSPGSYGG